MADGEAVLAAWAICAAKVDSIVDCQQTEHQPHEKTQ